MRRVAFERVVISTNRARDGEYGNASLPEEDSTGGKQNPGTIGREGTISEKSGGGKTGRRHLRSEEDPQVARILDAALETFAEYSYAETTTSEVARRSKVSKRDLYAHFPQKQVLLFSAVTRYLREQDAVFSKAVTRGRSTRSIRTCLEIVGEELVHECTSDRSVLITHLVSSEYLNLPLLPGLFFEGRIAFRAEEIRTLIKDMSSLEHKTAHRIAMQFLALITYLPSHAAAAGMAQEWRQADVVRTHVVEAIACVLAADEPF